jgi:hypothetical protein
MYMLAKISAAAPRFIEPLGMLRVHLRPVSFR